MLLSARMLKAVANVNSFEYTQSVEMTQKDQVDVYFQLIDKSLDTPQQYFYPAGRRYMPVANATLQVTLQSLDGSKTIVRFASQPFSNDPSIWKLPLMNTDQTLGTYTLQLVLTEGAKVTYGAVPQAITVQPLTQAFC